MIFVFMIGYNSLNNTMRSVESLMTRTHGPVKFHLLDNGSQDGAWDWMNGLKERFPSDYWIMRFAMISESQVSMGPYKKGIYSTP